jgi:MoxR-like ATPase
MNLDKPLIGCAQKTLDTLRALAAKREKLCILCEGAPGIGKSHLLDVLALELTGSKFAIETVNGQSLKIDLVREWRDRMPYGNLFSSWTVKRIDELDQANPSAQSELLTYLDYMLQNRAVLATTNEYGALRAVSKGRLETRFVRIHIDAPTIDEASKHIAETYAIAPNIARKIALGAVPEGCLASEGVNMRACILDAETYAEAREIKAA